MTTEANMQNFEVVTTQQGPSGTTEPNKDGEVQLSAGETLSTDDLQNLGFIDDLSKKPSKVSVKKEVSEEEKRAEKQAKPAQPKGTTPNSTEKKLEEGPKKTSLKMIGADGKEVELDLNTKTHVPVNGKQVEVTLEDLKSNFSGKVNWSLKMQQAAELRKSAEAEKAYVTDLTEEIMDGVNSKSIDKVLRAAAKHAKLSDEDTDRAIDAYYKAAVEQIKNYESMSPEARELNQMKVKESERSVRDQRLSEKQKVEQANSEITKKIETILQRSNMDTDVFIQRYDELRTAAKDMPDFEITPEKVENYHLDCLRYETADNVLKSLPEGSLPSEKVYETALEFLRDTQASSPDLTPEDLKEIATSAFAPKTSLTPEEQQELQAKVRNTQPKVQKNNISQRSHATKALTFDDLDVL